MPTKNINLTDPQVARVEQMVQSGRYQNASEYFRELLRHDEERDRAREHLAALLMEGINSGDPLELDEAGMEELKRKMLSAADRAEGR